jgi:manganese transport protein
MAGQVVLQGFVATRLNPVTVRLFSRALAILPALYVASLYGEAGIAKLLLLTQVVLSVQLPFVVIPLLALTADKKRMGSLANGVIVRWAGAAAALIVTAIDGFLVATYIA